MKRDRVDGAGLAACLLSVVVWQGGVIFQKGLTPHMNAGSLMLVQVGYAALLMWALLLLRRRLPPPTGHTALNVVWGMMAPGLVLALGIAGAARTDLVSIALICGFLPLLAPLLARLILREPLHWTFIAGGLIGLGGLGLMLADMTSGGSSDPFGNLLILASVCCSSLSSVIARFMNRGRNAWFQVATLQLSGATMMGIVIVLLTGWTPPVVSSAGGVLTLAYLVVFMTMFNYVAFNFALSRLPVTWVGLSGATAPAVGVAMAWLLAGTQVRGSDLIAVGVIISGASLPYLWRLMARDRG